MHSHSDRDQAWASIEIEARPEQVFHYLRQPAHHAEISGDQSVKAAIFGPTELSNGDRFGMSMKMFGVRYKMTSRVVEFELNHNIAWAHFGGHRWRYTIRELPSGNSLVTETFDLSTSKAPWALRLAGFPKRHEGNITASLENLKRLVEAEA